MNREELHELVKDTINHICNAIIDEGDDLLCNNWPPCLEKNREAVQEEIMERLRFNGID